MKRTITAVLLWAAALHAADGKLTLAPADELRRPAGTPAPARQTSGDKSAPEVQSGALRLVSGPEWQAVLQPPDLKPRSVERIAGEAGKPALGGYDPVGYLIDNRAVKGNPEIGADYPGGKYLFASTAHREKFLREPESYLPKFGGYCAYGLAQGRAATGNPTIWRVISGRLYLFESHHIVPTWERDSHLLTGLASDNWAVMSK